MTVALDTRLEESKDRQSTCTLGEHVVRSGKNQMANGVPVYANAPEI